VTELVYLSGLPCLERIHLQGNPVTTVLEYRATMFELFAERAAEVSIEQFFCTFHFTLTSGQLEPVHIPCVYGRVDYHVSHESTMVYHESTGLCLQRIITGNVNGAMQVHRAHIDKKNFL